MRRMLARTGIVVALMAGTAMMSGGVPAHASASYYTGYETLFTYYNNAQHSKLLYRLTALFSNNQSLTPILLM